MATVFEDTMVAKKVTGIPTLELANKKAQQMAILNNGWIVEVIEEYSTFTVIARPPDDNKNMNMSDKGMKLLCEVEGLYLKPYNDQTGECIDKWIKHATIGYGHLIKKSEWNKFKNGLSKSGAMELFECDLEPFVRNVEHLVKRKITQNQFDALVMLAFNIGSNALRESTVMDIINNVGTEIDSVALKNAWKAFNKSNGEIMQGLINRRKCELDVYFLNIYKHW